MLNGLVPKAEVGVAQVARTGKQKAKKTGIRALHALFHVSFILILSCKYFFIFVVFAVATVVLVEKHKGWSLLGCLCTPHGHVASIMFMTI